ncbi:sensor histidine kinase [Acetobacterium woodii]|uniref:histidine kinase n=1 Tax=Acetobacterium woodii (strain ATCC 29683 / DSM 1030 / JCM 2381 / KCTC 1655 / WB1) TaxID=931626 RepID=H6LKF2_ACEWD|nr:sensor histidine kinase [Acetobacterium woodii]AFA47542.1 two component system histidine kinase [Acetobacterium woodii DSM 1030]
MTLKDYLADKKYLIFVYSITVLFTGIMIAIGESVAVNQSNGLYVVEVSLLLFIIYLAVDFILKNKYYQRLKKISDREGLDWVNSLPAPISSEQRIYNELLQKQYLAINKKLNEYQTKGIENREFITMWVHEIKTPIAVEKLIIENSLDHPSEEVLYSIMDEIDKIEDFVQMTLFYSRTDDFAQDYLINRINLKKVVNEGIKREFSSITNKKLKLQLKNLDWQIDSDEKWLGFMVKQILDNAIKYSVTDGEISIYGEAHEAEVILIIEDEGAGIKEEDIRRVFDKNFTGSNGRKSVTATGMGLYLSQKIARKLGHRITISSDSGKGTKVIIHFPVWNDFYDV